MILVKASKDSEAGVMPSEELLSAMADYHEQLAKAGVLLATEGCLPSALGARVRLSGGKLTVTDGPFTESKELVAGFALLQATSREEAIELARKFLDVAGDGECEIRQVFEASSATPGDAIEHCAQLTEQFATS